jgi:hypothetical protein
MIPLTMIPLSGLPCSKVFIFRYRFRYKYRFWYGASFGTGIGGHFDEILVLVVHYVLAVFLNLFPCAEPFWQILVFAELLCLQKMFCGTPFQKKVIFQSLLLC